MTTATLAPTIATTLPVAAFDDAPLPVVTACAVELAPEMSAEDQAAFWRSGPPLCIHCR